MSISRPKPALAVIIPKLNRYATGRTGRQFSYENARARYNESASAAMKQLTATARPQPSLNPSSATPQTAMAVINPKLNRYGTGSFRSKNSYETHRNSYDTTAKTAKKLNPNPIGQGAGMTGRPTATGSWVFHSNDGYATVSEGNKDSAEADD